MFSIPNPCPKKWNEMTPVSGGNFCTACEKIVVDFSHCSNEEILDHLNNNKGNRVCGRFLQVQLVQSKRKTRLAKFAAALFFVFSSGLFTSCRNNEPENVVGDVAPVGLDSQLNANFQDSVQKANEIKPEAPFHLSPQDSAKVADSVEKTKNHVRDFE